MPKGINKNYICDKFHTSVFKPTPHQEKVLNYFPTSKFKGLLLYHILGSGKTCTAIMVADDMLRRKLVKKVFVMSKGTLRSGWIDQYCRVCGLSKDFFTDNFIFLTYNYNVYPELGKYDFNDGLVIIDEVHNLINGVKNLSKNPYAIYKKIQKSNCRILALSGLPISNETYEWSILGNLLKPNAFLNIIVSDEKVDITRWKDSSINEENLKGIVSYFPGNPDFYPTVHYHSPIKVNMTELQSIAFEKYLALEKRLRVRPPEPRLRLSNPKKYTEQLAKYVMATKWFRTRLISNFHYYNEEMIKSPDESEPSGWISNTYLEKKALFLKMSPKMTAVIVNILRDFDTKHMLYTAFKTKGGVKILHTLLTRCGIKSAVFSGDLSDKEREVLLKKFNNIDNRDGQKIKVLLVTEAGAEGINLLETNNVHILDSTTRENLTTQAIGRAVRFQSHYYMPKERQYVNVYRYWNYSLNKTSIDELLYEEGLTKTSNNDELLAKLIENSIEKCT